jgi:hypothetical protein
VKQAEQRGIWVPTQHLLRDQRKPRKTLTMKNDVFWDIKTQFVPDRRHITSSLKSPAG